MRIGLAGCGYWGRKLLRNFAAAEGCAVVRICDPSAGGRAAAADLCPSAGVGSDFDALLLPGTDAIVIATPPATHFELARRALQAGKHVLVEKPLTRSLDEAARLVRLAGDAGRLLMADHTFVHSPAVAEVARLVRSGAVGAPRHVETVRTALGRFSSEVNVVWDTAIHDFSILALVLGEEPASLSARGGMTGICGTHAYAHIDLAYPSGLAAHVHVSWLGPDKIRRLTLTGSEGAIVYEDGDAGPSVTVHPFAGTPPEALPAAAAPLDPAEPLARLAANFRDSILGRAEPLSAGADILPLMHLLDAADRSMAANGAPQRLCARTS